jgi:hypothetical protein
MRRIRAPSTQAKASLPALHTRRSETSSVHNRGSEKYERDSTDTPTATRTRDLPLRSSRRTAPTVTPSSKHPVREVAHQASRRRPCRRGGGVGGGSACPAAANPPVPGRPPCRPTPKVTASRPRSSRRWLPADSVATKGCTDGLFTGCRTLGSMQPVADWRCPFAPGRGRLRPHGNEHRSQCPLAGTERPRAPVPR